jgi:hypothetical protein
MDWMGYRIRKVDVNQRAIVAQFRKRGASVAILSEVGRGVPDLAIGVCRAYLEPYMSFVEIKDGGKPPSARKLTIDEQKFKDNWQGNYEIINSVEEVNKLMDLILNKD